MIEYLTYNIETRKEEWIEINLGKPIKIIQPKKVLKSEKIKKPCELKKAYYKKVWDITLSNDIKSIMNGKERGPKKYHIDHIYPISKGFKNNISPEVIGSSDNLRPLFWKDNFLKSARLNSGI